MASSFVSRLGTSPEEGIKSPAAAATTANITLSGTQTIDSLAVVAGDRVIVKDQTTTTENGIYVVAVGAWARAADFNAANDVVNGVLVHETNNRQIYQVSFSGTWTVDTTVVTFYVLDTDPKQVYDTVALMVADTALKVGDRVRTLGHASLTSGGGADYQIVAAATGTHDNGSYIDLDTHQAKALFSEGPVNVRAFGAVADAVTDDGPAFQAAIDYGITDIIAVRVPSGTYKIGQTLNLAGNDITFLGDSMETVALEFTSAVTGPMLDVNAGGVTRRFRGNISDIKLIGAKLGSNPNWYDDTYYSSSGIDVEHVVNGLTVERVRVLKTNDNGIAFKGASNTSNTWFNTIKECFVENCKGNGYLLEANSNGVKLSGNRAYLCEVGYKISDSFAIEVNGCGSEDTNAEGMILSAVGGFSITGSWFEDHGLVTTTAGAIDINGVVGDATRPTTGTISGCLFNSATTYAIDATNTKLHISGCKALNDTVDGIVINADCEITEKNNLWDVTGVAFSGAGAISGLVDAEGTWTPVISDAATAGNTATFDANATSQKYWKRGNMMTVQVRLENIDTTGMTAGNILYIQSLPVAASATNYMTGNCQLSEITISGKYVVPVQQGSGSTTAFYFTDVNTAATKTSILVSDVTAATADIFLTMTYSL